MKQILIIEKRKKARRLKGKGWSIRRIAKELCAGKDNVSKWIKTEEEGVTEDKRGWKKGRLRKHTKEEEDAVVEIRRQLEREESFFYGADIVRANYREQYGKDISQSFIDKTIRARGLVKYKKKEKKKGRSTYMSYPVKTIAKLGKSLMSMDFIGPKYLRGSSDRINFLSIRYIRPYKRGYVKKIEGQTTQEVMKTLSEIWKEQPIPEVIKVDNDSAFGSHLTHESSIGRLTIFLLNLGISPLYISPRSPWNNGEVEGFNSVFAKKFWNRIECSDQEDLQIKIEHFNVEYERYSKLVQNNPAISKKAFITDFTKNQLENRDVKKMKQTKIYFLRKVMRVGEKTSEEEKGTINILRKDIELDKKYINLFTFCTLDLKDMKLCIEIENEDGSVSVIKRVLFPLNNVPGLLQT